MFQLQTPRHVRLKHINLRTEKHGKNDVDAVDLDFVIEGTNEDVLSLLSDDLCDALYYDPDASGQEQIEGVKRATSKLRFPRIGAMPWSSQGSGMDLTISWGIDEEEPIEFFDGKASTKAFMANEGGTVMLGFRYSNAAIPDGALDKLRKKQKQMVEVTMVQQERMRTAAVEGGGEAIDGSVEAFEADHPDAGQLFAEAHGEEGAEVEAS